jgi:hypothetical protein
MYEFDILFIHIIHQSGLNVNSTKVLFEVITVGWCVLALHSRVLGDPQVQSDQAAWDLKKPSAIIYPFPCGWYPATSDTLPRTVEHSFHK